jgi:serine/threonine-protein kinase
MVGNNILHYKILKKLGEGGMGVVYLAEDTRLKRKEAIKFLPQTAANNIEASERFKIEAQAAAALNYPNIPSFIRLRKDFD